MFSKFKYIKEIIVLLGQDGRQIPWMILLFLSTSLLDLAGLGLVGPYVAVVINPALDENRTARIIEMFGIPLEQNTLLILLGAGLLVVFVLKFFVSLSIIRIILRFSQRQQVRLQRSLIRSYQHLSYSEYIKRNSSEYVYSIHGLSGQFSGGVVLPTLRALSDGIVALVILVVLALTNGPALVLLITLLGVTVICYDQFFRKKSYTYGKNANDAATRMIQGVHEAIEGLKEIRILGKEKYFFDVVSSKADEYAKNHIKSQFIATAPKYLIEFLIVAFVVLLVSMTISFEQKLDLLIPTLGMFAIASLRLVPAANVFVNCLIQLRFNRDSVSRLHSDFVFIKSQDLEYRKTSSNGKGGLQFSSLVAKDIWFGYETSRQPVLAGVSIELLSGESVGIIGLSGSGKSTLVDILLGLLRPDKGEICFNGIAFPESMYELRSQVAYLPQHIFLTDNTLKNNVALGVDDEYIDEDKVLDGLEKARLSALVEDMPLGINTMIGERGLRLSGGQRQRVALARAFYHGKNLLIMDEATSALDNETEKEIIEEIQLLKGKKTVIVIAHRISTIQYCDRVYRLDNGVIIHQ